MKKLLVFALVLLMAISVFAGKSKVKTEIAIFADTLIGDTTKTFAISAYEGLNGNYGTAYNGKSLWGNNTCKFGVYVDTLAAETADSVNFAITLQTRNNVSRFWSKAVTLTTLTADSLYEWNVYDIPARTLDELVNADSVKVILNQTDGDPTGNFVGLYFILGEDGE